MVEVKDRDGNKAFSLHKDLHALFNRVRTKLRKEDTQFIITLAGKVGCGKSVSAMRGAYIIDENINLKRICFDKEEFIKAILECKKYSVIIADEGISIFFSRAVMTKGSRVVMELMNQIRQKNLCLMICIPDPTSLDKLIYDMVNCHIDVYESRKKVNNKIVTIKGNMDVYPKFPHNNRVAKIFTYYNLKRRGIIKKKPPYWRRITGNQISKDLWLPVDSKEYKKKKMSVLYKFSKKEESIDNKTKKVRDRLDKAIKLLSKDYNQVQISEMLNIPRTTIRECLSRVKGASSTL